MAAPTTPPPGPGYTWDGTKWVNPWVKTGVAPPPPPPPSTAPPGPSPPPPPPAPPGTTATDGSGLSNGSQPPLYDPNSKEDLSTGAHGTAVPATGQDGVADSAAARALREQLLAEREAANNANRTVPLVDQQGAVGSAFAGHADDIVTPTIAQTGPVQAGEVKAATIDPIERVNASAVAQGPQAYAGQVYAATINQDPQEQFRQDQRALIDDLRAASRGETASAAELQGRRQAEEAMQAQLSLAGAVHGRGAGAAIRNAGREVAKLHSRASLDAALLRATEMKESRGQLAGTLGQGREQDIGLAVKGAELKQGADTTTAQLGTQVSISNADREAARLMKNADLEQAANTGNAAAQNERARRQAELTTGAATTTATLAEDASKATQQTEAQKAMAQADLDLKAQQANADNTLRVNLANAGFDQQAILATSAQDLQRQLANVGFQLTQEQIDDLKARAATDAALQSQKQMLDFDTGVNRNNAEKEMMRMQLQAQYDKAKKDGDTSTMNAVISAAATAGVALITALSDERAKKKIRRESDGDVDDFLSALESWSYEYKDQGDGEGRKSGPMAQELERSAIGRGTVRTDEQGRKGVDTAALTMALAGAVARMRKEQRRKGAR